MDKDAQKLVDKLVVALKKEKIKQDAGKSKVRTIFDYNKQKALYVMFTDGRKKEKLRKFISQGAIDLTKFNKLPSSENKKLLIAAYNINGVEGVTKLFMKLSTDTVITKLLK